jgi:putative transposase
VLTEHDIPIAPNTYHARKKALVSDADLEDAYLVNAIVTLWRKNKELYGIRKMWWAMRRAGFRIGRDRVGRLMRIAGVQGVRRGDHRTVTTGGAHGALRHPDLLERGWSTPTKPDTWWVADFTYVWTLTGFVYVSFITDVYSRRILGWRVMSTKETALVSGAVEQALAIRRRQDSEFTTTGLVHHSDAGSQYTSLAFTEALEEAGIAGSIGRTKPRSRRQLPSGSTGTTPRGSIPRSATSPPSRKKWSTLAPSPHAVRWPDRHPSPAPGRFTSVIASSYNSGVTQMAGCASARCSRNALETTRSPTAAPLWPRPRENTTESPP